MTELRELKKDLKNDAHEGRNRATLNHPNGRKQSMISEHLWWRKSSKIFFFHNSPWVILFKTHCWRASLVVQWLRICLALQGIPVPSLVWDDPTCHRATKPMHHNYWACALEPRSRNYWAHALQLLKPTYLEPVLHNKRSQCNEKPAHCNEE